MGEASKRIYGTPEPKQMCVWAKDMIAMGSFYRAQHELCFVYKSGNEKHVSHLDLSDRIRSNVWKYPSAISVANPDRHQIKNHPTPKPVQMIADAILDTTNDGDIVIDWFLGSGTALIACEKTKRRCFATELNIRYVQQIIKRYIKYCRNNDYEPEVEHLNGNLTLKDFENGSK
jgi:DNA modification methylase